MLLSPISVSPPPTVSEANKRVPGCEFKRMTEQSPLLNVFLVPGAPHGLGAPPLLLLAHIVLEETQASP